MSPVLFFTKNANQPLSTSNCNEIDIVIAWAKMCMQRCITVVFECILAQVVRLRDGYMVSAECAMYA